MRFFDWFAPALACRGIGVPGATADALGTIGREFGSWWMLSERAAVANRGSLAKRFPGWDVLPFARRTDCDDVACVVLRDADLAKGCVAVVHDGAMPGSVVDVHPDLTAWLAAARP